MCKSVPNQKSLMFININKHKDGNIIYLFVREQSVCISDRDDSMSDTRDYVTLQDMLTSSM